MAHDLFENFVSAPPFTDFTGHSGGYQVGHGCIFNRAGRVTGVRFHAGNIVTPGVTYTVKLWEITSPTAGTAIATKAVLGSTITANAWNNVLFDTPVAVIARKAYLATVHRSGSDTFATNFFLTEPGGLRFTEVAGQKAETPHHSDLAITGTIDVRMELSFDDPTPDSFFYALASKMEEAGLHTAWIFELKNATSRPRFWATNDGGSETGIFGANANDDLVLYYSNGHRHAIRVVYTPNNGASQKTWKFYHAPSITTGDSSGWTQLGTTVTFSGATSLFNDVTAPVRIGNAATTDDAWGGKVFRFQVRNGEGGTIVTDVQFTLRGLPGQTEVIDESGKVYTLSGGASIVSGGKFTEPHGMLYGWTHGEVLTPRLGTVDAADNFSRVPQALAWGTPNIGTAWVNVDTAGGDPSTETNYGLHTIDTVEQFVQVRRNVSRSWQLTSIKRMHLSATPTAVVRQHVRMRYVSSSNYMEAVVRWKPDGTAELFVADTLGVSVTKVIPGVTASQPVDLFCRVVGFRLLVWAALSSVGVNIEAAPLATIYSANAGGGTTELASYALTGATLPVVARWGDLEIVNLDSLGTMSLTFPQGVTSDFTGAAAATVFPSKFSERLSQSYYVSPLFDSETAALDADVAASATMEINTAMSMDAVLAGEAAPADISMSVVPVTEATLDAVASAPALSMDAITVYGALDAVASPAQVSIGALNLGEPGYDATSERLYRTLPEFYRRADTTMFWVFKKWLTGIGFEINKVDTLIDRFKYITRDSGGLAGDTSDLTDPLTADLGWLPWLAQHVGVVMNPSLSEADQRLAILQRLTNDNQQPGTKGSLANAARSRLTGSRSVNVYDHTTDVSAPGDAGPWDVLIVTVGSETPGGVDPRDDVIAANAKPAGVRLYHRTFESVWDDIEAALVTWAQWHAAGSWREIEEIGL